VSRRDCVRGTTAGRAVIAWGLTGLGDPLVPGLTFVDHAGLAIDQRRPGTHTQYSHGHATTD
jgi:hypothetical protein